MKKFLESPIGGATIGLLLLICSGVCAKSVTASFFGVWLAIMCIISFALSVLVFFNVVDSIKK